MDHYLDIKVLPDPEFLETVLMNAVFAKLHRALVDVGQGEVGISFPHAAKTPGNCLRLHASAAALTRVMAENWLKGMRDFTEASQMQAIPAAVRYRVVKRVQVKSSPERLYRRSVKKGWVSEEEALEKIKATQSQQSKLPFLQLKSNSNGQKFCLFIDQGSIVDVAVAGRFSDYGLSDSATIPHF